MIGVGKFPTPSVKLPKKTIETFSNKSAEIF
jgi:hypothetical protein